MEDNSAVLIFAKIPRENFVKTRLINDVIQPRDALELYYSFLKDTIMQSEKSSFQNILFSLTDETNIDTTNLTDLEFFSKMKSVKLVDNFHIQLEGTFGQRMKSAVEFAFEKGYSKVIVLGADSPHIQPNRLDEAKLLLDHNDIVLGPSPEGGIYLIGFNKIESLDGFEEVFEGVELLRMTEFAKTHGYQTYFLPELTDIDTERDLVSLIAWVASVALLHNQTLNFPISVPSSTIETINRLKLTIQVDKSNNRKKKIAKAI